MCNFYLLHIPFLLSNGDDLNTMFYSLEKNVYLVVGAEKSCIYDFNNSKLYHINNALSEKLQEILDTVIKELDTELRIILEKFEELGLIKKTGKAQSKNISEIRKINTRCKFAWIEITNKCNLKCIHCYNESEIIRKNVMSIENYKLVVDCLLNEKIKKFRL